jgi:parvulin-like peptidyl-prolyl isomerase
VSPVEGRSLPWQGLDEERRGALLLYGLIGFVVVFGAILVGYAYYKDKIAPNHETVLNVGGRKFDLSFLERRVRSNLNLGLLQGSSSLQQAVVTTLQGIEIEELARRVGADEGVAPTDAEIDNKIREIMGLPDGIDRNTFAAAYRQQVLRVGLPVNEYREIVAAQIIQQRLVQKYTDAVPDELEQVDAQIIKTADETKAKEAKSQLDAGQKFNVTAATYSIDSSKDAGGELGWIAKVELVAPKAADALFTLPVGQISDPIQDVDGWYIVLDRGKEVRPVDADHKSTIAQKTFNGAIQDARDQYQSTNRLTQDQILTIGRDVLK